MCIILFVIYLVNIIQISGALQMKNEAIKKKKTRNKMTPGL